VSDYIRLHVESGLGPKAEAQAVSGRGRRAVRGPCHPQEQRGGRRGQAASSARAADISTLSMWLFWLSTQGAGCRAPVVPLLISETLTLRDGVERFENIGDASVEVLAHPVWPGWGCGSGSRRVRTAERLDSIIELLQNAPGTSGRRQAPGVAPAVAAWLGCPNGTALAGQARHANAHSARARGERVGADPRLRFDDAATAWWEARVTRLRPATHSAYAAGLAHLRRRFGGARMTDITPSDVAKFIAEQQRAGLKGWTIKGQMTVLSSIFAYSGRHLGLVGVNPVSVLHRVERPSSDDERPKRLLRPPELRRLLDEVDEPHKLLFELAAEAGCRLAEALRLVWGEVDFAEQTVTFTSALDRQGRRAPLKTSRSRRCVDHADDRLEASRRQPRAARSGRHHFGS
jgi:Phage integrase family